MRASSEELPLKYDEGMNYARFYKRISSPLRSPRARRLLRLFDKLLVLLFVIAYAGLLITLAIHGDPRIIKVLAIPLVAFVCTALLRVLINRPRPSESCDIDPLIRKESTGKSLPSLHVASAVVISITYLWIIPASGPLCLLACCAVAGTRIIGGLHFPSDVACAAVLSLLIGISGLWLF